MILANQWKDKILNTIGEDKILAYKRGAEITTNKWRDKIMPDKWEDQALTFRWGGQINVPGQGGTRSSHLKKVETYLRMVPRTTPQWTMLPQTWTMILWMMLLLTRMMYKLMGMMTTHNLIRRILPRLQRRGMFTSLSV